VREALGIVVVAVAVLGVIAAAASLAAGRRAYEEIGRGGLAIEPPATGPEAPLEDEVRAHVERRNASRVARGDPPLDVEAEVGRRLRERGRP
jgi:hypothetical protein